MGNVGLKAKPVHQQNYCNNKQEQFDNWSVSPGTERKGLGGDRLRLLPKVASSPAREHLSTVSGHLHVHTYKCETETLTQRQGYGVRRVNRCDTVSYIFIGISLAENVCLCRNWSACLCEWDDIVLVSNAMLQCRQVSSLSTENHACCRGRLNEFITIWSKVILTRKLNWIEFSASFVYTLCQFRAITVGREWAGPDRASDSPGQQSQHKRPKKHAMKNHPRQLAQTFITFCICFFLQETPTTTFYLWGANGADGWCLDGQKGWMALHRLHVQQPHTTLSPLSLPSLSLSLSVFASLVMSWLNFVQEKSRKIPLPS